VSSMFYKAINCQRNLDNIFINRYWPIGRQTSPTVNTVRVLKLHREGYRQVKICNKLNLAASTVNRIVKNSGIDRGDP